MGVVSGECRLMRIYKTKAWTEASDGLQSMFDLTKHCSRPYRQLKPQSAENCQTTKLQAWHMQMLSKWVRLGVDIMQIGGRPTALAEFLKACNPLFFSRFHILFPPHARKHTKQVCVLLYLYNSQSQFPSHRHHCIASFFCYTHHAILFVPFLITDTLPEIFPTGKWNQKNSVELNFSFYCGLIFFKKSHSLV